MAQVFSLKDQFFNAERTGYLAGLFGRANDAFDAPAFEARVMSRLGGLELKERIVWISDCLGRALPGSLPEVAPVLRAALPPPLDPNGKDDDFGEFIFAPLGEFVVAGGLEEHPDLSLDLLEEITQRFSMEWAIRPFLNRWPDLVMQRMKDWAVHPSTHVRRLVSEGTRPRLPWGQAVGLTLDAPLGLLDELHGDHARFVTRSVANHLNDISKKDPDLVMDRLQGWQGAGRQEAKELDWMTRHALRGLVKAGHPRAMKMLGYDPDADLDVTVEITPDVVRIGEYLTFSCEVQVPRDTPVLVDYLVHFHRPAGRDSVKVFKLKQGVARAGAPLKLEKKHKLKGDATTFRLVPGAHRLEIQVNGVVRAGTGFELLG
jgi:3-methyladenine DNA glycosylase AlkC